MKATDLLRNQHREVETLFTQSERAQRVEREQCEALARLVVAHSVIEKEIFYPACTDAFEGEALDKAYEEHGLVELTLQKLLQDPDDNRSRARRAVLKDLIEHHVQEEEDELFRQAERRLGDDQLNQLGARMERRFEQVRRQGYEPILREAVSEAIAEIAPVRRARKVAQPTQKTARRRPAARKAAARKTGATKTASRSRRPRSD